MRVAIISDIHGNLRALEAVLADIAAHPVDGYILLGDHVIDFPWPDEVVERVKELDCFCHIKGNKESYLEKLEKEPSLGSAAQFGPAFWSYHAITEKNRGYLRDLPESAHIRLYGTDIYAAHIPSTLLGTKTADELDGSRYVRDSHAEFLAYAREKVRADETLQGLAPGIYLFGHTHAQWYVQDESRLFINPGSCGLPLDRDSRAAYTILEYSGSAWQVHERRVRYDIGQVARDIRESPMYAAGRIYNEFTILQMAQSRGHLLAFLQMMEGQCPGIAPYPNDIWDEEGEKYLHEHNA